MKYLKQSGLALSAFMLITNPAQARMLDDASIEQMVQEWAEHSSLKFSNIDTETEITTVEDLFISHPFTFTADDTEFTFRVVYRAPWMKFSPADASGEAMRIQPSETFDVELVLPKQLASELDQNAFSVEFSHEGLEVFFTPEETTNLIEWHADRLASRLDLSSDVEGFDSSVTEDEYINTSGDIRYPKMLNEADFKTEQITFFVQAEESHTRQFGEMDGKSFEFFGHAGLSSSEAVFGGGAASLEGSIEDFSMEVSGNILREIPNFPEAFAANIGLMKYYTEIPLFSSEQTQEINLALQVQEFGLDDEFWDILPIPEVFKGSIDEITLDFSLENLWRLNLLDLLKSPDTFEDTIRAMSMSAMQPIEPRIVHLNALAVEALGTRVEAVGGVDVSGDVIAGEGVTVSLSGWQDLLDDLVAVGVVPQQEAIFGKAMLEGMAKTGEQGESVFDLTFENGFLNVNDNPVAPLPPLK